MGALVTTTTRAAMRQSTKGLAVIVMAVLAAVLWAAPARAANPQTWQEVSATIASLIDQAVADYKAGDAAKGKEGVNDAYYKNYETTGMEKQVMARISGSRVSAVEMEFSLLKQAMGSGDSAGVDSHAATLKQCIAEDAAKLDGVAPASGSSGAGSADYSPGAWGQTAKQINGIIDQAVADYKAGDAAKGSHAATLTNAIREDANTLDGYTGQAASSDAASQTTPWLSAFVPALLVILREGMEAILVVAAVLAYLGKSGHKDKARVVWSGVAIALGLSALLAFLFNYFTSLAGANQELLEGVAALFAVAMLIWVSNWMIHKSSDKAWEKYIRDQTDASLTRGSLLGLAFISFLAVLREGAETILFYVPIVSSAGDRTGYVWAGLGVGLVVLVVVYLLIQFAALRIPLRPFFTITSLLLALMAFTFTGSGVKELQEADVLSLTYVNGFPTVDLLGIYPRVENLVAQALVLIIIVGLYVFGKRSLARASGGAEGAPDAKAD